MRLDDGLHDQHAILRKTLRRPRNMKIKNLCPWKHFELITERNWNTWEGESHSEICPSLVVP